jgi:hypothetical protein
MQSAEFVCKAHDTRARITPPQSIGESKFQLYFDAGGERKLQIKGLKKPHCLVHAEWRFETSLSETDSMLT